ncbi:hypothetical protein B0G80_5133 [Paraburkholderia sp. BL6669N2]|uniref:hypothetical protein n=1 Tax=Paraburkholderia sp. BL6669N2 TaxID=1938807 RepID=UPI000E3AF826|nr:hypothetical protein [Paraburkholderia sp. BL6669N2]REG48828.1 hypothetical protein B0G80_5133 [Paraburkholderia sp. BL6669N2]
MISKHTGHRFVPHTDPNASGCRAPPGPAVIISALVVCWWTLIETALDFAMTDSGTALAVIIGTRLIVIVSGLAVVLEARIARPFVCFLCAMSILAVAPTIALQFNDSLLQPAVSFIDCATKALFLTCTFVSAERSHRRGRHTGKDASPLPVMSPRITSADNTFRQTSSQGD